MVDNVAPHDAFVPQPFGSAVSIETFSTCLLRAHVTGVGGMGALIEYGASQGAHSVQLSPCTRFFHVGNGYLPRPFLAGGPARCAQVCGKAAAIALSNAGNGYAPQLSARTYIGVPKPPQAPCSGRMSNMAVLIVPVAGNFDFV